MTTLGFVFLLTTIAITRSAAYIAFVSVPNPITIGEPQTLTWASNDTTSPVTIILRRGVSQLVKVEELTDDATGGQFIWTPKSSLDYGTDYALEVKQRAQVNVFGPITLQHSPPGTVQTSGAPQNPGQPIPSNSGPAQTSSEPSTSSRSSKSSATGTTTSSAASSAISRPGKASHESKKGLSTGSAIGIGITIAGVIAILAVVAFVCYKRRLKAKGNVNSGVPPTGVSNARLKRQDVERLPEDRFEKDGGAIVAEMSTKANTHELGGTRRSAPYELPSN